MTTKTNTQAIESNPALGYFEVWFEGFKGEKPTRHVCCGSVDCARQQVRYLRSRGLKAYHTFVAFED